MPVVTSRSNNNPFLSSPTDENVKTKTIYNNKPISSVLYSASADNLNCNVRGNFVIKMKSNTGNNKDSITNNNNNDNECISKFEITQTAYRQLQIESDDDNLIIKTYPTYRRQHTDLINQNNENGCQISTKVFNSNENRVGVEETTANNSQSNKINEIDIGAKLFSNSLCLQKQLDNEITSAADVTTSVGAERKGNTNPFINNDNDEKKSAEKCEDEEAEKNNSHYNNNINVTNDKLDLSHNNIQSSTAAGGGSSTPLNNDETLDKKSILHMPDFNDFGKSIDNMSDDDLAGDDDYDDDAYCKSEVIDYVLSGTGDDGSRQNSSPTNAKLYHPPSRHQPYLIHNKKQVRRVVKDNHFARRGKYDSYNSIARQVVKNKTVSTAVVCQDKKLSMATVLYTTPDTDDTHTHHTSSKSAIPTCSFNRQDYSNHVDDQDETPVDATANSTANLAKNMKRINIKKGLVKSLDLFNFSFVSHHSHRQQRINGSSSSSKTQDMYEDKCSINNMKTSSTKTSANMIVAPGTTNTWGKYKSSSQKHKEIFYPTSTSSLINTKRIGRKGIRKNIEKDTGGGGGGRYFDKIQAKVKIQLDKLEQKCKRIHKSSTHNSDNMKHSHTTLGGGQTYDIDDFLSTAVSSSGTRARTNSIYLQKYDNRTPNNNKYIDNNDKFCDRPNHNKFLYKSYKSEIDLTKNLTYLDAFLDEKFDMGIANNQSRVTVQQQQDIVQMEKQATKNCNYEHRRTKSYTKNNAIVSINQSKDRQQHILDVSCEEDSSKTTSKVNVMVPPSAYTTTSSSLSSSDYASGYSYSNGSNEAKEKLILTFDDNPVGYAMANRTSNSVKEKEKKTHLERHKYHDEFYDVDKKDTHYMLQQHHYSNSHDYNDIYDDEDAHMAFSYTNLSIGPPSTAKDVRYDNFHGNYMNDTNFSNSIPALEKSLNYAQSSVIASKNLSLDESNLMHHYEREVVVKRKSNNKMMSHSNSNSIKELTYHENYLEHYSKNKSSINNLNLSQNSIMCGSGQQAITSTQMTHNLFYDLNAPMGPPIAGNVNEDNNTNNEHNGIVKKRKSNNSRNNKVTTTSLGHHYRHHNSTSTTDYNSSTLSSNAILQNSAHRMNNDTVSSSTSSYQSTSSGKSNAQRVIVSKSNNKQIGGGGGELVVEYEC